MTVRAPEPEGYEALRHGVGAYRVAVDTVSVAGRDATAYLQGQLSQDISPLEIGGCAPALLLEPDGKLSAFVRVTRTSDDAYVLDTDAGFGDAVMARLQRFKLRTKVAIEGLDWPCIALRGERVGGGPAGGASHGAGPPFVLPVDWNGVRGVDLLGPGADALVPADASWCDAAAWEALRVEAGIPKMGAELDSRTIAAEAHLVERTVSFTKGCYTGQELVARLDARGSRVARRLCGIIAGDAGPGEAEELVGAVLWTPDAGKVVGRCTSASWCPGLGHVGALAYLHRSVDLPSVVVWARTEDVPAARRRPAKARSLPLVD
ncbi:MAG: YgfZ/GcvT domain-containing protein [Acidimicrobiales bacterium]